MNETIITRLKEITKNYEDILDNIKDKELTSDIRQMLFKVRKDILEEMINLITRLK